MGCHAFKVGTLVAWLAVACLIGGQAVSSRQAATEPVRIAVVVSTQAPINSLSLEELRRIFFRQITRWPNGWAITVYERTGDNPIREQFSRIVLAKDPEAQRQHWLNLKVTQGMKGPKPCSSTALLKQYLERVKGGIGYMYLHEVDNSVKVVKILKVRE